MQNEEIKAKQLQAVWLVGVGGRGLNTLNRLMPLYNESEKIIAVSDNEEKLQFSSSENKYNPQKDVLGSFDGMFPHAIPHNELIIVINGLGGGSEKYVPKMIDVLRNNGNFVIPIVSMPFRFEAVARKKNALKYKESIKEKADITVVFENDRILATANKNSAFPEAIAGQDQIIKKIIDTIFELSLAKDVMSENIYLECLKQQLLNLQTGEFEVFTN